jgi:hypothetical protein
MRVISRSCFVYLRRLLVVSDISCDIHGGIEFLERSTTIDQPSFQYDPITGKEAITSTSDDDDDSNNITVMGVDILPTELPLESSTHFGNAVRDLLDEFVQAMTKSTTTTTTTPDDNSNGGLDIDKLSPRLVRNTVIPILLRYRFVPTG